MTVSPAMNRMIAARAGLILDQPFFGALALRIQLVEDPTCKTAWTDGTRMGFSPAFVLGLSRPEVIGLMVHEVMHCANGHPWRRDGRAPRRWNVACDRVINPIIRDSNIPLPEGALYEADPSHAGKSAEWVYARIPEEQEGKGQGSWSGNGEKEPGEGEGNGSGSGYDDEVRDAPTSATKDENGDPQPPVTEADWEQAVEQAAMAAKAQGNLPAGAKRFASQVVEQKVDWRSVLRRFVQEVARADYTWRRPNARYLAGGLYLPSLRSEEMGPLAVAIDTSGSIDEVLLNQFKAELQSIVAEARPRSTAVLYCDARVHRVDTFLPDDVIDFKPVGGGGTDFRPVFNALGGLEDEPVCVVYLTDMYGTFPQSAPDVPTLWVSTSGVKEAPFGEVVQVMN